MRNCSDFATRVGMWVHLRTYKIALSIMCNKFIMSNCVVQLGAENNYNAPILGTTYITTLRLIL